MKTILHINQHVIRSNAKSGKREPVITCKTYKNNDYGHEVEILDKAGEVAAKIVYRPDKPLSCGAKVWIETHNEIIIHDANKNQNQQP